MSDDASEVIARALASEYSIFLTAPEIDSAPERDAFLDEACDSDVRLRASVEDLLRAHDDADNLLDAAPADLEGSSSQVGIAEGPGLVIGGYKLIEQIGEGGFGLVFVAEQQKPVRRKVALKIVKPGMDTREVIARFEAERQALAVMDHPNIARVFDAGATAMGRPFFVMELVRGVPINEYCDQQELNVRQRLELFIDVCHAVQHAHTKGIIHRDLKPTNILVASHDGVPVAKVIDFGVAKAVGHSLTDKTIYTRFAEMIGTPIYMSPEQAELSGLDVDTRSDIYSLGVILYELLTGTTPADPKRMKSAAFDEVRRIIREVEPLPPSTRITTLGQSLVTVSSKRNVEPRKLSALLRGDIDWIVMKALEKDRTRRYQTPIAFADDVRRYLKSAPIEARPPSKRYRFQKFARRNVAPLVTAALVFAALVAGTVVSTWQAFRARAERDAKELALADAEAQRRSAVNANERLQIMTVSLARGRSLEERRRWAAAYTVYSQAIAVAPDSYHVWRERGSFFARLGLWKLAAADYREAADLGLLGAHQPFSAIPELMLLAGDQKAYDKICARLLHVLRTSPDSRSTLRMMRSLCMDPDSGAGFLALARRADLALKNVGATPDLLPPAVLVHYRAEHYERALELANEAARSAGPHLPLNHCLLAMIHHRLGDREQSLESLAAAGQSLDGYFAQMEQAVGTNVGYWFEWIPCFLLYCEAYTLIHGTAAPDAQRMKEMEKRVLAEVPDLSAAMCTGPEACMASP